MSRTRDRELSLTLQESGVGIDELLRLYTISAHIHLTLSPAAGHPLSWHGASFGRPIDPLRFIQSFAVAYHDIGRSPPSSQ